MPTYPNQTPLRFNLRKSRSNLLFSAFDRETDYKGFLRSFNKTLDAVSRASKQIPSMIDGILRPNRFSALDELEDIFPQLDTQPLRRIKRLYNHLDELDDLYVNPQEVVEVWEDSVTFFESLVKAYLKKEKDLE